MTWSHTDDVDAFLTAAGPFLRSRPVEHTLLLTVSATVRRVGRHAFGDGDPVFGWWRAADGGVGAAYLRTPPRAMVLTRAPDDAATALARDLTEAEHPLPGVNAHRATAEAFGAAWCARHAGVTALTDAHVGLYRLGELTEPVPAPSGHARVAQPADLDLLVSWWEAFHEEIGEGAAKSSEAVAGHIDGGALMIWETGGRPVAMACRSRTEAGMARVMAVYTPPASRQRGYAGAVTVAVSRAARQAGAHEVVLHTDLANPTSNALYQRLGYRAVEDRIVLSFTA